VLIAEHVTKAYGQGKGAALAVKETDLRLAPGELTVLVGESGSGKTTLSRMLAGIIAPTKGAVLLDGRSIAPPARKKDRALCARIQMVLQDGKSALDPRFSVYRSIAEPIRNLLANEDFVRRADVAPLMKEFSGLSGSAYKFTHNGTDFYMLKLSNVFVDPKIEDVILYVPSTDNIIHCRCKNSCDMEILSKEKDFEIEAADIQKYYDSTFVI